MIDVESLPQQAGLISFKKEFVETLLDFDEYRKLSDFIDDMIKKNFVLTREDTKTLRRLLSSTLPGVFKLGNFPNATTIYKFNKAFILLNELANVLDELFTLEDNLRKRGIHYNAEDIVLAKKETFLSIITLLGVVFGWNNALVGLQGEFLKRIFTQTRMSIQEVRTKEEEKKKGLFNL